MGQESTFRNGVRTSRNRRSPVSVIISHFYRQRDISGLLEDISKQEIDADVEICEMKGLFPAGKARNRGAERAGGEILVFMDDDIRLGNEKILDNLIKPLTEDDRIGICGSSQLIPRDSKPFQRRCAREISHSQHPVVEHSQEVGMVGSACCGIRKELFFEMGEFDEYLMRGEDQEFCYRLKKKGFKIILVSGTWIYHPLPRNLVEFVRANLRRAEGVSFVDIYYPHLNIDTDPRGTTFPLARRTRAFRLKRYMTALLKAVILGKELLFLDRVSYLVGYSYGSLKYRITRRGL